MAPAESAADLDVLRLAGSLVRLQRVLDQRVRAAGPEDGLNLADLGVLSAVSRGADAPTLIARAVRLDPARITHITGHLVGLHLLQRTVDAADRRRWQIRLTAAGSARLERGRLDIQAAMEDLLVDLLPEERQGMVRAFAGIQRVLAALPA